MTRVVGLLSKKKDQMAEYQRQQNEKFDRKIEESKAKTKILEEEKARFNEDMETRLKELQD